MLGPLRKSLKFDAKPANSLQESQSQRRNFAKKTDKLWNLHRVDQGVLRNLDFAATEGVLKWGVHLCSTFNYCGCLPDYSVCSETDLMWAASRDLQLQCCSRVGVGEGRPHHHWHYHCGHPVLIHDFSHSIHLQVLEHHSEPGTVAWHWHVVLCSALNPNLDTIRVGKGPRKVFLHFYGWKFLDFANCHRGVCALWDSTVRPRSSAGFTCVQQRRIPNFNRFRHILIWRNQCSDAYHVVMCRTEKVQRCPSCCYVDSSWGIHFLRPLVLHHLRCRCWADHHWNVATNITGDHWYQDFVLLQPDL